MNQEQDWNKLATETKVVAAGRPEKNQMGLLIRQSLLTQPFMKAAQLVMPDMAMKHGAR